MFTSHKQQRGNVLIIAVTVIVLTALLATVLVRLSVNQSASIIAEAIGQRAHYAARSGSQIALYDIVNDGAYRAQCSDNSLQTIDSYSFTIAGLQGCSYQVSCRSVDLNTKIHFRTVTTASCTVGGETAQRKVLAEVVK